MALNFEAILLNDLNFRGIGANMELENVPPNHTLSFLLCDNEFSIFTEGKDLQPLDFKISGFAVCNVLCFTEQNRKKFHLADKKLGKKFSPSRQKKW